MALFKKFLFLFFMGAASLQAASLFSGLKPKDQQTWLKLLHFESGHSTIDEETFFLSQMGKSSASAELEATLSALTKGPFKKVGRLNLEVPCAYPARVQFLEEVGLLKEKSYKCPDWQLWVDEVDPDKISIVFSTAYPNNPGSMFGHTFLKFHKKNQKSDLLNYGANYSALTNENDIGVVYAFKGVFGGYRGFFDLSPYYVKVNEYNHGENRDLIEYELNLTRPQVWFVLKHLWELYQGASFDYYFTGENCSYHLAKLIDVALDKPLLGPKSWFYLPADLIHALYKERELVSSITDRPSKMREVKKALEEVKDHDRVKAIFHGESEAGVDELDEGELFALSELLNLEKYKEQEKFKRTKLLTKILREIATRKVKPRKSAFDPFSNRPHLAHQSQKVAIGGGSFEQQASVNFIYQSGYHDLLANDQGLEPFSEFRFLSTSLNYLSDTQKFRLQDLMFIKVNSLHPWSWFSSQLSWQAGAWVEDILENPDCRNCYRGVVQGKMGLTVGHEKLIAAILLGGREEVSSRLQKTFNHMATYEALLGLNIFERLKLVFSWEGRHNVRNISSQIVNLAQLGLNYSFNSAWELRSQTRQAYVGKSLETRGFQTSLMLGYYF